MRLKLHHQSVQQVASAVLPAWDCSLFTGPRLQCQSVFVLLSARRAAAGGLVGRGEALVCRADGSRLIRFMLAGAWRIWTPPCARFCASGHSSWWSSGVSLLRCHSIGRAAQPIACGVSLASSSFYSHAAQPIDCSVSRCRAPCSLMFRSSQPHCERARGAGQARDAQRLGRGGQLCAAVSSWVGVTAGCDGCDPSG